MHRLLSRFGAVILLLTLGACIPESQNPAGDPAAAVKEPALNGLWQADWEDGRLFLHVFDSGQGMIEVYTVNHKQNGTGEADHYEGFISNVGKRHIVNLQTAGTGEEDSGGAATYVFLAYQLQPDGGLLVHFVDDKPFIAAVTGGKLKGEVTGEGDNQTVLLSDEAAKIGAFIAGQDDATLYGKDIQFHRVYPQAK
jgi:hypothetical protein